MIGEFFLNIVFGIASGAFEALPNFAWSFDSSLLKPFFDILNLILYFFPVTIIEFIFSFYIWKKNFQIIVAILRTIWDILPLV